MPLITRDEYKNFIRVTTDNASYNAYIDSLIAFADAFVKNWCKQKFEPVDDIIEYYYPRDSRFIRLKNRPVRSITNLWYDPTALGGSASGAFASGTLQTSGIGYFLQVDQADGTSRSGLVFLLDGQGRGQFQFDGNMLNPVIVPAYGTIKVQYDAGFNVIPEDLKFATLMLTRQLQVSSKYGGLSLQSESTNHYSYSLSEVLNKDVQLRGILAPYRGMGMSV